MGFIKKDRQKKEETETAENKEYQFPEEAELKECRYCQVMIPKTARICPNCGKRLKKNWIGIFLLLCVFAACGAGLYYYLAVYSVREAAETATAVQDTENDQAADAEQGIEGAMGPEAEPGAAGILAEVPQDMEGGQAPTASQGTKGGQTSEAEQGAEDSPASGTGQEAEDSREEAAGALAAVPDSAVQTEKLPEAFRTENDKEDEVENKSEAGKEEEPEKKSETEDEDEPEKESETGGAGGLEKESETGDKDESGMESEAGQGMASGKESIEEDAETEDETRGRTEADQEDADSSAIEVTDVSDYTEEEFRTICQRVDYKKLLRSQEDYLYAAVMEELTVVEQVDGGLFDENIYYLCKREDSQGITRYYIIRDDREEDDTPILAGDVIQVYGQLFGSCKLPGYLVKTQPVVPALAMIYYDLLEE